MNILREWYQACSTIASFRNQEKGKLIQRNTRLYRESDEEIRLKLHQTDIIIFTPHIITLNTGGWYSRTTKDRMNTYLKDWHVYQHKHEWYVTHIPTQTTLDYENNMELTNLPSIANKLATMDRIY